MIGVPPRESANLLLCRLATEVDGRLFLHEAGAMVPPRKDEAWYIAGSIDVIAANREGELTLIEYGSSEPVDGCAPVAVAFRQDGVDEIPPNAMIHFTVAARLPDLPDDLPPGFYGWQLQMGDFVHTIPFLKPEALYTDVTDAP